MPRPQRSVPKLAAHHPGNSQRLTGIPCRKIQRPRLATPESDKKCEIKPQMDVNERR